MVIKEDWIMSDKELIHLVNENLRYIRDRVDQIAETTSVNQAKIDNHLNDHKQNTPKVANLISGVALIVAIIVGIISTVKSDNKSESKPVIKKQQILLERSK